MGLHGRIVRFDFGRPEVECPICGRLIWRESLADLWAHPTQRVGDCKHFRMFYRSEEDIMALFEGDLPRPKRAPKQGSLSEWTA